MTTTTAVPNEDNKGVSKEQALAGWGDPQELIEPAKVDEGGKPSPEDRIPHRSELEAEKAKEDEKDEAVEELEEENELEPEPIEVLDDPGEFVPKDYSFEVVIYEGEEGKEKPRTVKIKSIEDAESLLDKDPNFGSARELLNFNRKVTRMETSSERDKDTWQRAKNEFEAQSKEVEDRQQNIANIANEINYLVSKGKLPKVDAKYANTDWTNPNVAKLPGVKEQVALLNYMAKENRARSKAGLQPLSSAIDAFNSMQLDEVEHKRSDNASKAAQDRKEAGARIAGTSPTRGHAAPSGIAVGRVAPGGLRGLGGGW